MGVCVCVFLSEEGAPRGGERRESTGRESEGEERDFSVTKKIKEKEKGKRPGNKNRGGPLGLTN